MLNSEIILARAGQIYADLKYERGFTIPPEVVSDQIRAIAQAICEELNKELEDLQSEIRGLDIKFSEVDEYGYKK